MVHFVTFTALPATHAALTNGLRNASLAYYPMGQGSSIVVTYQTAVQLRDWLRASGAQTATVIRMQNEWGTWGNMDLAQWLQNVAAFF